jgi:hypothetical protein
MYVSFFFDFLLNFGTVPTVWYFIYIYINDVVNKQHICYLRFHVTWIQVDIADFVFVLNIHILFVAAD